jgi:hypothetical protein
MPHAVAMSRQSAEVQRARRFGWTSLLCWTCAGLLLEAAHGWKVSAVLDDELTRALLRLGHAHGVGLSLLAIVHGELATSWLGDRARAIAHSIWTGAVLVPFGFALGAIAHPEGDPGVGVLLVPIGALALIVGLGRTSYAAWTEQRGASSE